MRVLLVDDHATLRVALRALLDEVAGIEVVGECADGSEVVEAVAALRPELVLMDINMPVVDGIEATLAVKRAYPDVRVVGLSGFEDATKVSAMIAAGAGGYLLKTADPREIAEGLQSILAGRPVLAPEVLQGVLDDVARFYREQLAKAELLAEVDRMKRQFFTLVSDDLRNPLAAITGYARTMRQNWTRIDEATREEFTERIEQQSLRLGKRIEQMLTISGIRRAEPWEATEFDLGAAAREAAERFDDRRLSVRALDSMLVRGDRGGFVTAAVTLIENALQHTQGVVLLGTGREAKMATLMVRDEGPGMEPERLRWLLAGPFARIEQGEELEEGGSLGLSIYIARMVLEAMGGVLEAESSPIGGSAFVALVPLA
ncbi:MAG TPA: response regulator [Egibacteraceae bacterium]|nr:response regulator [Egibacteraceae bacterium]